MIRKILPNRIGKASTKYALWRWFPIPDAQEPDKTYLLRLRVIQCPLFSVFLHYVFLPDRDRDPHDHPWSFFSFICKGGYVEEVFEHVETEKPYFKSIGTLSWPRFSWHRMPWYKAHTIRTILPGTVTLVITGRRKRDWGFWTEEGWEHYLSYIQRKYPEHKKIRDQYGLDSDAI